MAEAGSGAGVAEAVDQLCSAASAFGGKVGFGTAIFTAEYGVVVAEFAFVGQVVLVSK